MSWKEAIQDMPCGHGNSVAMAREAYTETLSFEGLVTWYI